MRVRYLGPSRALVIDGETVERGGEVRISKERFDQLQNGRRRFEVVDDESTAASPTATKRTAKQAEEE